MRLKIGLRLNLRTAAVKQKVDRATQLGVRDVIVEMHNDAVKDSPFLTGHNRRSLGAEVSGMGVVAGTEQARVVNDSKIEGALYSTSGYGGYLETGTIRMPARPYIKPALDRRLPGLPGKIRNHLRGL